MKNSKKISKNIKMFLQEHTKRGKLGRRGGHFLKKSSGQKVKRQREKVCNL